MTISIVPALLAIAGLSDAYRERCVAFIASEIALIERNVAQAIERPHLADRPVTQELRAFLGSAYGPGKSCSKSPAALPAVSGRLRQIADEYFSAS
ncbi:hypothetical protein [Caballeronia terrestris]|uniref:hypothetical protein n=1 Tax=Caballeronia terrestris TaxID=1226301 RepID=UPI000ABDC20B|nr:hypothetical protein [Caballeronia terrestris]